MRPVELIERAIRNSSKSRDTVLDLFGGSGSTIIACEKTGRHGRMIEIDPRYVDTAVRRWEQYTGEQAMLHAAGETSPKSAVSDDPLTREQNGAAWRLRQ